MNSSKTGSKPWIAGLVTAIAASLCCITPVLALISGTSSIASNFSWMEPFRPYLIGVTIAILGFAWFQKLKPGKADKNCDCEPKKSSFWQSKTFLGIVTGLAIMLMAFPIYSNVFFPSPKVEQVLVVDNSSLQQVKLTIKGLSCEACTQTINFALLRVPGVLESNTRYQDGSSLVKFDRTKTNEKAIVRAVNATGYEVTNTMPVNDHK